MRRLLLVCALVGCGRIAFDPLVTGDGGKGDSDADDAPLPIVNNLVFATSERFTTLQIASAANADQHCNRLAQAANLPGNYVAWISDASSNAISRIQSARGWVRIDGRPVADVPSDITNGKILHPITLDENGVVHHDFVLTGTNFDGTRYLDCNNWTDGSPSGQAAFGWTYGTRGAWGGFGTTACAAVARIYCLGVSRTEPLVYTQATGRRAFVTSNASTLAGGIDDGDNRCMTAAASITPPGSFRAVLATSTASAASRFDLGGPRWVRLDGVGLTKTAADLFSGNPLVAPLNLAANGTYLANTTVRTGSTAPNALGLNTCLDWRDTTSGSSSDYGLAATITEWFTNKNMYTSPCVFSTEMYCLEE